MLSLCSALQADICSLMAGGPAEVGLGPYQLQCKQCTGILRVNTCGEADVNGAQPLVITAALAGGGAPVQGLPG